MFVEVAKGSPINRGILIPHSHLPRYLQKEDAIYRSVYLYGDDAKEYVDQTGSLKNFFGLFVVIPIIIFYVNKMLRYGMVTHQEISWIQED